MLAIMLMVAIPVKNTTNTGTLPELTCPDLNKRYPITILKSAHSTFTVGDDSPFPGGLANGVGNLSPQTPFAK